jgi:hypothetical protein
MSPDRKTKPAATSAHPAKTCVTCGRSITWRKKWERDWDAVKYCSDACRSHKPGAVDARLEAAILQLLNSRGAGKTICPSEAARAVSPDGWEAQMEPARAAARRLVSAGKIVITQGGVVVDPSRAKGPIRLRKA